MTTIDSRAKSIKETLHDAKYGIDYYQREYKWERKHLLELLDDLTSHFLLHYHPDHEPTQVERYPLYFLGSIVLHHKQDKKWVIDGQQRLTTLTLLLIYLHHLQEKRTGRRVNVQELIFSEKFGKKSFNLQVEERVPYMEALYANRSFSHESHESKSVRVMGERYEDIEESFPKSLQSDALPYFIDWLLHKVIIVHIESDDEHNAYSMFESMNDRGLMLNPTEMLKGYLLSNMEGEDVKERANTLWKKRITALLHYGKDEETAFFRHWFRAKYAQTLRERQQGAENKDFEKIGTSFHKWVRDHKEKLNLRTSADFSAFVLNEFDFYVRQYLRILEACKTYSTSLEHVYYSAHNQFTHQFPLLLASLLPGESQEVSDRKINTVAYYLDCFVVHRVITFSTLSYSTIAYTMYKLIKEIRDQPLGDLVSIFQKKGIYTKKPLLDFHLHRQNKRYVHYVLARLTHYVEQKSGMDTSFDTYITKDSPNPYQIEHIWANHYERFEDLFNHESEFALERNRLGGLLLLPKRVNQSYGDATYEEKRELYFGQNVLAQSLHPLCYQKNPGFIRYMKQTHATFCPYDTFDRQAIKERQQLYRQLAWQIWNPTQLKKTALLS